MTQQALQREPHGLSSDLISVAAEQLALCG
jgi:hypothetical protein